MGQKRAQGTISEFDSPLFVSGTWIGAHSDTMNWLFLRCLTGRVVSSEACQPPSLIRSSMRKDRFRWPSNGDGETYENRENEAAFRWPQQRSLEENLTFIAACTGCCPYESDHLYRCTGKPCVNDGSCLHGS